MGAVWTEWGVGKGSGRRFRTLKKDGEITFLASLDKLIQAGQSVLHQWDNENGSYTQAVTNRVLSRQEAEALGAPRTVPRDQPQDTAVASAVYDSSKRYELKSSKESGTPRPRQQRLTSEPSAAQGRPTTLFPKDESQGSRPIPIVGSRQERYSVQFIDEPESLPLSRSAKVVEERAIPESARGISIGDDSGYDVASYGVVSRRPFQERSSSLYEKPGRGATREISTGGESGYNLRSGDGQELFSHPGDNVQTSSYDYISGNDQSQQSVGRGSSREISTGGESGYNVRSGERARQESMSRPGDAIRISSYDFGSGDKQGQQPLNRIIENPKPSERSNQTRRERERSDADRNQRARSGREIDPATSKRDERRRKTSVDDSQEDSDRPEIKTHRQKRKDDDDDYDEIPGRDQQYTVMSALGTSVDRNVTSFDPRKSKEKVSKAVGQTPVAWTGLAPTNPTSRGATRGTGNRTADYTTDNNTIDEKYTRQMAQESEYISADQTKLKKGYREHHSKDFKRGTVFLCTHHEARGDSTERSGRRFHGEEIYSKILRVIVLKTVTAHSLCVPIMTYGGQGCLKPGLKKREIESHAVAYDTSLRPEKGQAEIDKGMIDDPIGIETVSGETLDPKSRIRFDKVYTIEHNSKLKLVGKVRETDIKKLITYAKKGVNFD